MTHDLLAIDPPWYYPGDPNAMGAAGKHYTLMPDEDVLRLDVRSYLGAQGLALVWATCPRLNFAIEAATLGRVNSEIEAGCWQFTLDGCDAPDARPWAELLASGDHKRIVSAVRTHYLDWVSVDIDDHIVTRRQPTILATKRQWNV